MSTQEGGVLSERRVVTVLFADMAGSTAIFERLDPETVTDAMNEIFAVLGAEVEAVGGTVDKVVGDELMALFGAPVAHEDDAVRAVRAALALQRAMGARGEALLRTLGQAPRLRIGIHSGQVVWGVVGPPGQARPTVMGDVVNLASRLQRAAPEGGILVSEAVARQIQGAYLCKAWEPIVVKGKAEPVAVYEVLGERERAEPMYRPPFVNREQDLEQLEDLFARARRGRVQVVVISGDPGVGKTRLVEEFTSRLPEDALLLQTACPPYGGQSLGPLADLFRQLAGLPGQTTLAEVEARIPLGERAARAAVVVSRLFNLAEVPPGDEVSHETALLVAAETVRRLITRPTVVWIEDLQWADSGTRELLPFMMERLADAALLLIGNLRAGEEPLAWGKRTALTTLPLGPLPDEDARALLSAIVGERLPEPVEHTLIGKAGGNPFYLSEMVAALRGVGLLVRDDYGRWRITGPVERVLPETIHGALLARLDRLPPEARTVTQRAAVVGMSFRQSLLVDLTPGTDVPATLRHLEEAGLTRSRDPLAPDPEYDFVHPLLREVAYSSLLTKHQVALHQQVAEAMERLYPDEQGELAKTIGIHYDRGGDGVRALPYLLRAGRQAIHRYATREAIQLLERVYAVAEETQQRALAITAGEMLGEVYPHVQDRGPKEWFNVWQGVLKQVDPKAEPLRAARAALGAANARAVDNQPEAVWPLLKQAEPLIPPGHVLWSEFHQIRARTLLLESKYREALDAAKGAVEVANRRGTLLDRGQAYNVLAHPAILPLLGGEGQRIMRGWLAEATASGDERLLIDAQFAITTDVWTRGRIDEDILRVSEEGLRKAREYGRTRNEAELEAILGYTTFLLGRWPESETHLRRARELVEETGGRMHSFSLLITLPYAEGSLAIGRGRLEEARRLLEDALAKSLFHAPIHLNYSLARCHLMLGDVSTARAAMERSLQVRDRFRCIVCGCMANGFAAEFYAVLGEADRAAALMEEAEATASDIGHVITRIRVRRARARLAISREQAREAIEAALEALSLEEGLPLPQPYAHAQSVSLLAAAYRAAGDHARAVTSWREAQRVFGQLGAAWDLQQVEEALSQADAAAP